MSKIYMDHIAGTPAGTLPTDQRRRRSAERECIEDARRDRNTHRSGRIDAVPDPHQGEPDTEHHKESDYQDCDVAALDRERTLAFCGDNVLAGDRADLCDEFVLGHQGGIG